MSDAEITSNLRLAVERYKRRLEKAELKIAAWEHFWSEQCSLNEAVPKKYDAYKAASDGEVE